MILSNGKVISQTLDGHLWRNKEGGVLNHQGLGSDYQVIYTGVCLSGTLYHGDVRIQIIVA